MTAVEEQPPLFPDLVVAPEEVSADRRRTLRQRRLVDMGVHPLTRDRACPQLGTCGDCAHRVLEGHRDRSYPKCELGPRSSGPATDVRRWWPACRRHTPRP